MHARLALGRKSVEGERIVERQHRKSCRLAADARLPRGVFLGGPTVFDNLRRVSEHLAQRSQSEIGGAKRELTLPDLRRVAVPMTMSTLAILRAAHGFVLAWLPLD